MKNFYFNKDTKVEVQNGVVTLSNNEKERVNLDFKTIVEIFKWEIDDTSGIIFFYNFNKNGFTTRIYFTDISLRDEICYQFDKLWQFITMFKKTSITLNDGKLKCRMKLSNILSVTVLDNDLLIKEETGHTFIKKFEYEFHIKDDTELAKTYLSLSDLLSIHDKTYRLLNIKEYDRIKEDLSKISKTDYLHF